MDGVKGSNPDPPISCGNLPLELSDPSDTTRCLLDMVAEAAEAARALLPRRCELEGREDIDSTASTKDAGT